MFAYVLLHIITAALFGAVPSSSSQVETPTARVTAHLVQSVRVHFAISAADQDLFIPNCGGKVVQTACVVRLQVESQGKWHTPKLKSGVMGFRASQYWKTKLITANQRGDFLFVFPKTELGLRKGQHLRIAVDAWTSEESMKSSGPGIRILSEPFVCP